jgi:sugar phosphate isomerase/epimerase
VATVKEWIGHSVELGAPEMRIFAGNTPEGHSDEEAFHWTVEGLIECAKVAAERGVVLALENHGGITLTAGQVIRLIEAVDSEWLRLNMDTGNFREDPYEEMSRTASLAVTAHMKAAIPMPEGRVPVDVARVIGTLHKAGYRGFVNVEYEEEEDPMTGVPKLMAQMKSALANLA